MSATVATGWRDRRSAWWSAAGTFVDLHTGPMTKLRGVFAAVELAAARAARADRLGRGSRSPRPGFWLGGRAGGQVPQPSGGAPPARISALARGIVPSWSAEHRRREREAAAPARLLRHDERRLSHEPPKRSETRALRRSARDVRRASRHRARQDDAPWLLRRRSSCGETAIRLRRPAAPERSSPPVSASYADFGFFSSSPPTAPRDYARPSRACAARFPAPARRRVSRAGCATPGRDSTPSPSTRTQRRRRLTEPGSLPTSELRASFGAGGAGARKMDKTRRNPQRRSTDEDGGTGAAACGTRRLRPARSLAAVAQITDRVARRRLSRVTRAPLKRVARRVVAPLHPFGVEPLFASHAPT